MGVNVVKKNENGKGKENLEQRNRSHHNLVKINFFAPICMEYELTFSCTISLENDVKRTESLHYYTLFSERSFFLIISKDNLNQII